MRFVTAIIWLGIAISIFSGALYCLIFLELPIGQRDAISNISYYLLSQDPNNILTTDYKYRTLKAEQLLSIGVVPLLSFITIFWIFISIFWILTGEFLKIDRPNKAFKFFWIWFVFLFINLSVVGSMTIYLLYFQEDIYKLAQPSRLASLVITMLLYSTLFFYIVSMFITSRVIRPAVPLLTIILRN